MEEEFQGGVCGGNWWNSSRNLFNSPPCSAAVDGQGWLNPSLIVDMKTAKSLSDDSTGNSSDGGGSVVLQEPHHLTTIQNMPIDSTLEMMTNYWNQDLICSHDNNANSQENYSLMLQSLNSTMDSSFKQVYQSLLFPSNSFTQCQEPPTTTTTTSSSFPLNTASYGYTSSLLQTLLDTNSHPHQPLLDSQNLAMNSMMRPTFPKQHHPTNNFNNTPFWNATAAPQAGNVRPSFLPSSTPQLIPSALTKVRINQQDLRSKHRNDKSGEEESVGKKGGNEPSFKRPRIETPSPLPTFKVRKEKLGDRVTALQQLVSPFGKTDTASVLHEAIEYIKLLHNQVTVLSTPYLKNGQPPLQRQQGLHKINDEEETMKDLRSRGLCLVPISSTFPVATETTADFWTPSFGASFR